MHEVNVLDILIPEAGSFYIMDRGFTDFARLYALHQCQAFFIIRAKSNLACRRVYSHPVDKVTGLRLDQTVALAGYYKAKDYPQHLRRIKFYDAEHDQNLVFLTNNFDLPALTVAQLYRCRWQVELFFKWIKQHLRIKAFYGTTENAVKNPNLDRHHRLCAGRHHQKTPQPRRFTLHNSTSPEPNSFRENSN